MRAIFLFLFLFCGFAHAQNAGAQNGAPQAATKTLRVATRVVPPFVTEKDGKLDGFSIALWNAMARELKVQSRFNAHPNVKELLKSVQAGRDDVGIAAISITAERENAFDFSQPMFDAGLHIMVRASGEQNAPGILSLVWSKQLLQLCGIILLLILVPAHLVYFVERGHKDSMVEGAPYFPGIFKAAWWAAGTLATQADEMPKSPVGRIVAVIWMFSSVVFVAYFTANVTASQTVQQLRGSINGPSDLPGKRIATTVGSTATQYLREQKIRASEYAQFEDCAQALLDRRVDAVVFDAPVLLYFAAHEGNGKTRVVGEVFRKQNYGIVMRSGSRWRKPINAALLRLKENGTYDRLYDQWFSRESR